MRCAISRGLDPRQAEIVELKYFAGLSETEVAAVLSLSRATVTREWQSARAWLYRRITKGRARTIMKESDRWPRVKDIFHSALARAPHERGAFVREECREDSALREDVDLAGAAIDRASVSGVSSRRTTIPVLRRRR